jgi:hypothetical protein
MEIEHSFLNLLLIGTIVRNNYLVGEFLGAGVHSRVYAVTDTRQPQINVLVIKICISDSKAFKNEEKALRDLK